MSDARSFYYSKIIGVGSYLPPTRWSNDQLAHIKNLDTSDEWIQKRTGIAYRHIADAHQACSDLGVEAARNAIHHANVSIEDIDLIIVATTTPDNIFPATAARIQAKLGAPAAPAFDVQAVCSGFIFALMQADNMIKLGQAQNALVIGAETYSRILDWQDRGTCVLFGDGAGAVVLSRHEKGDKDGRNDEGILGHIICSDGRYYDELWVDGGAGSNGRIGTVKMNGKEVFRQAVEKMADVVSRLLTKHHMTINELDWLIPHQANRRIIQNVGARLGHAEEKTIITVQHHANTSAATIPIALDSALKDGRIQKGDLIAFTALGGGFSWGASLLRW